MLSRNKRGDKNFPTNINPPTHAPHFAQAIHEHRPGRRVQEGPASACIDGSEPTCPQTNEPPRAWRVLACPPSRRSPPGEAGWSRRDSDSSWDEAAAVGRRPLKKRNSLERASHVSRPTGAPGGRTARAPAEPGSDSERERMEEERGEMLLERARLSSDYDCLELERDVLALVSDSVAQDRDSLAKERDRLAAEVARLAADRARARAERGDLRARVAAMAGERDRLAAEREALREQCERLEAAHGRLCAILAQSSESSERTEEASVWTGPAREKLVQPWEPDRALSEYGRFRKGVAAKGGQTASLVASCASHFADLKTDNIMQNKSSPNTHQTKSFETEKIREDKSDLERDAAAAERDAIASERDGLLSERGRLASEVERLGREQERSAADRDSAASERDRLASELESVGSERDRATAERDAAVVKRDAIASERERSAADRDSLVSGHCEFLVQASRLSGTMPLDVESDNFSQSNRCLSGTGCKVLPGI